nr:ACP S-malonyltransferase [uncultured Blautia sp.]
MSKIAFIYPGQGAQSAGMGQDFYEKSPLSRAVFDQGSQAVNLDLKKLCFEKNDLLDKTEYTQVAMVTACLAMTRAIETMGLHPDMTAGLSLGEYCAIAAAGGMCDLDAIRTVRSRGIFMEHAAPEGTGAMSAVLGLDSEVIENTLKDREGVSIANYNCPGQIVITGEKEAVKEAGEALKEAGARRVLPLKVSGPFHSPMMKPAGEELKKVFASVSMNPLLIPYVANINAEVITDCGRIEDLLVQQVSGSVRWQQSVETMIREGVDTFVEIGPGKTLTGFLRKIDKNVRSYHIGTWEEALSVCEELESGRR